MTFRFVSAILASALVCGCSSIVSKSSYPVVINSNPDAASFEITNRAGQKVESGQTPATVTLKSSSGYFKGEAYTIVLKKPGYQDQTYTINSTVDGWYFGNILFGGLIGMLIVDPATGAMYNLPDRADIPLEPDNSIQQSRRLFIDSIDSLDAEQLARLKKIN